MMALDDQRRTLLQERMDHGGNGGGLKRFADLRSFERARFVSQDSIPLGVPKLRPASSRDDDLHAFRLTGSMDRRFTAFSLSLS